MRDMLPRKPGTSVTDIKKSLKESLYSNGMSSSTSPLLRSPSGGADNATPEGSKGLNFKPRSGSPHILKNSEQKNFNTTNCASSNSVAAPNTLATASASSPVPSPGIQPISRSKLSPHNKQGKLRQKQRNKVFDFEIPKLEGASDNFCANNNNNSKHREKSPFNLRHLGMKAEEPPHASRTPSTNSASDLSPTSLPTTDDRTTATPSGQNLDDITSSILEPSIINVDDKAIVEALNDIRDGDLNPSDSNSALSEFVETFRDGDGEFPDAGNDLELDRVTNSNNLNYAGDFAVTSEAFLFDNNSENPLGGKRDQQRSPVSMSSSTATTATCAVTHAMIHSLTSSASSLTSSVSSPTFHPDSTSVLTTASSFHPKFSPPEGTSGPNAHGGKSHLQDILGVTDTIRLKNMSRSIDSVPYKSPTTTSYSASVKPHTTPNIPTSPCSMAPPQHKLPSNMGFKPRPQFMYNEAQGQMFRQSPRGVPPFMDGGMNQPWNRGSPHLHTPPGQMRSPTFPSNYVETSVSPTNINPMSGLQITVDSIPAPVGTSGPNTPVGGAMGPPLMSPIGFDGTPPPGGRMRPPPSPSVTTADKRCVSVDSVTPAPPGKKTNKRERTRSADSKEEEKKETSGPKSKRRKSRSKEDNGSGKKSTLTRSLSAKGENGGPRLDSALSKILNPDIHSSNPFIYIFNTEVANKAANLVSCKEIPDIIVYHRSFVGNGKLSFSSHPPMQKQPSAPPSVQMPTTNRSPTELKAEKIENSSLKSPKREIPTSFPDLPPAIHLQETKLHLLPMTTSNGQTANPEVFTSQSDPTMTSNNGEQQNLQPNEELSAEKRRNRENKLGKLKQIEQLYLANDGGNDHVMGQRAPGWNGRLMNYPMQPNMDKPRLSEPGMMGGPSAQSEQASVEWHNMVQNHHAKKRRNHEGIPGEPHARPPPPYHLNGPQPRWPNPDGYPMERMPMDMNPRFRMGPANHRPRMPDSRVQGNFVPSRMVGPPRGPYQPNSRMPMYDPYRSHGMIGGRPPSMGSRLPPPGMRQPGVNENYPFSEQLMKQASFYNREPTFDSELGMIHDWPGPSPEGTHRLSHMSGASNSPGLGVPPMPGMEMDSRMTPVDIRMPNPRGFDPYPQDIQRYDMMPSAMGSPQNPMDGRIPQYCSNAAGSMMDAMARRGEPRPPDLNLNSQLPPRSPMNYHHVRGPLPSPGVMTSSIGPRYPNPGEIPHPPQPSPMHGARSPMQSPSMGQYLPMGPSSTGMEPQVMLGGGPHSAGPISNPPSEWVGPNSNMADSQTPGNVHPMMASPGMMTSQPGMTSQPVMMTSQPGMMTSQPGMMTPGMMTSQPGMTPHHVLPQQRGPSTLSIMMNQMSKFKMPEQSPLYQEAVKDTASPPPLNHNEPPPLSHNTVPSGMRIPGSNHPPSYDSRMGPPRLPGPQMNDGYQGYATNHPSPLPPLSVGGNMMMGNMGSDSMQPPSNYVNRPNYGEGRLPEFDLRGILPSEKPSQTISYLPPENTEQFSQPPQWGGEGIRPQHMQGPMFPSGPAHRPLI